MGKPNNASVTWSIRIPHWLSEEVLKLAEHDETKSDLARRAFVALVASQGETDA